MPINRLNPDTTLMRHELEIQAIKRQMARLASPAISNLSIYPTADVNDLDLNDGNTFISKDQNPNIIFVVGNTKYSVPGNAL